MRRQRSLPIRVQACGPSPTPPGLEEAQRGDQPAEALDGGDPRLGGLTRIVGDLTDADHTQKRRLPGRDAEPVGRACLGRDVDGVGADDGRGREVQPPGGHLQTTDGHDQLDLALLDVAAGLELIDRGDEPLALDREVGAPHPQPAQEDDRGELRARARLGGDADAEVPQVTRGEPRGLDRSAAGAEGVEFAEIAGVVADEDLGLRLIPAER
jgi:hypothetical protein